MSDETSIGFMGVIILIMFSNCANCGGFAKRNHSHYDYASESHSHSDYVDEYDVRRICREVIEHRK